MKKALKPIRYLRRRLTQSVTLNYKPNCRVRYGWDKPAHVWIERILKHHEDRQREFMSKIVANRQWFAQVAVTRAEVEGTIEPYWHNGFVPCLDGMAIYTVLESGKPQNFLEIGSGNSTKFARRAITDHGLPTKITSIDPVPRVEIDAICDAIHRQGLEDVDLGLFDELQSGDVVFIDGSHRAFQNSDVTVFFLEVLPRLKEGVIVGIHDIFWPYDYPENFIKRYYNEQYMMGAYMLGQGLAFPLIFSTFYATLRFAEDLSRTLPEETVPAVKEQLTGGSIWFYSSAPIA